MTWLLACEGPAGPAGAPGAPGTGEPGTPGTPGLACWDTVANGKCDLPGEDTTGDGKCDLNDCRGAGGAGGSLIALEANGVVGFVRDVSGKAVVGATVYLVPSSDIPSAALDLSAVDKARQSTDDEPLEDPIAAKGSSYGKAVTDANGVYRIASIAAGTYFLTAVPASSDTGHLPGGSECRVSKKSTDLLGKQIDIDMSSTPSASAEYVGASVCYNCHGIVHEKQTLHMLGIQVAGKSGPMQDSSRFPTWNKPLEKFTAAGTTLYFYAYNGNTSSPDWKVSETNPGAAVSFTAVLRNTGGKLQVSLNNVAGTAATQTYDVELSYGGGLYKQRWVTKIGASRYVLPIQFNFEGQTTEAGISSGRWVWQQYNAQNWYDEAGKALKVPAKTKSFDNNCAGCHFTGVKITGDASAGFQAHAVPDPNGEYDFDGDGKTELMNISCETCHGPGSEHWAKAGGGHAIVSPGLLTPEREVTICAACHTRALGVGGGATEAPLDAAGRMPRAGISRSTLLTNHVSKLDDGLWDKTLGDGTHSKKHHQQVSDFIKSKKYRNGDTLMTCSSCHDLHGDSGLPHQLIQKTELSTDSKPSLCFSSCHTDQFTQGTSMAERMRAHWSTHGVDNSNMGDIGCPDCHMTKTAKSGAGRKQLTIGSATYWSGDISSHFFDVPLRAAITGKTGDVMPTPYTNGCGAGSGCHTKAP